VGDTAVTGAERYFKDRMKDPEYRQAYDEAWTFESIEGRPVDPEVPGTIKDLDESVDSLLEAVDRAVKLQKKARQGGGYLRLNPKGMR
jgi:hypothetical protein